MKEIKRKWDLLPKAKRQSCVDEIITFFKQKRSEQIGVVAAEDILDFFLQDIGTEIYNKGVEDSKELLKKQLVNMLFVKEDMLAESKSKRPLPPLDIPFHL